MCYILHEFILVGLFDTEIVLMLSQLVTKLVFSENLLSTRLSRKKAVALIIKAGYDWHVLYDEVWLLLVHAILHGLDRGDFLSAVQTCSCSVHKSLVKLTHGVLFQPLSLVDLQPTDYFIFQVFVHGSRRQGLLGLSAPTKLIAGALPVVP